MATSKKSAIDQRVGGVGWIWPEATPPIDNDTCKQGCVLVGLDTDDGPGHKYYDRRVTAPIAPERVRAMRAARAQDIPPIDVVRVPGSQTQFYVKVGRKRVLTMRQLNRELIAAGEPPRKLQMRLDSTNDEASTTIAIAQENLCREEPNPLDGLAYIERIMADGYSVEDVSSRLAVSTGWVRDRLALKNCCPELAAAIDSRKIGLSGALLIAAKPQDEQVAIVTRMLSGVAPTARVKLNTAREAVGKWSRPGKKQLRMIREVEDLHPAVAEFIDWVQGGKAPSDAHGLAKALEVLKPKPKEPKPE